MKKVPYIPCSKESPLTYTIRHGNYSEIRVDKRSLNSYSPNGVSCCYSSITRANDTKKPDDVINISKCTPFTNSVNITDDFVMVKCATRHRKKEVYKNAHAVVNIRPEVQKKMKEKKTEELPLSVLMIGVDSISRLNALRTFPLTTFFLDTHGWIELKGYNKIADNTYPNLMAVLTGIDGEKAYDVCLPIKLYRLDNCSFIWKKYHEGGYITGYGEDEYSISTFNYNKIGFVNPPTDYYLRPYVIAAQKELKTVDKHSLKYCVGPTTAGQRIFNYAQDFATTFVNQSTFGLFWTNSFSHNDLNSPSSMDKVILELFQNLYKAGVMERSLVVFFSDHGMRFGDVRQTKMGWFEERLPFVWLSVPKWFRVKKPKEWRALKENAARLTTPYDLHMTLQHVLVLGGVIPKMEPSSGCPKCKSLFQPIDVDRSCDDAAISPHWCVCTVFKSLDINSPVVKTASLFVVERINAYLTEKKEGKDEGVPRKCAHLTLSRTTISQIGTSWDGTQTYYLLFVETLPGRGKFEATVSLGENSTSFQLYSSISRLDTYAGQSHCINNAFLKKYCYCR